MSDSRDYSALLHFGRCTVCQAACPTEHTEIVPWVRAHASVHLADGTAVVESVIPHAGAKRINRVVPTSSIPDEKSPKPRVSKRGLVLPKGFKRWTP